MQTVLNQNMGENPKSWKEYWATAMLKTFSAHIKDGPKAEIAIISLLDSIEQGNSCITLDHSAVESMGSLVSTTELAKAPFHFDGSHLFLDRHHRLEVKLVNQVSRLVAANTQNYDVSSFDFLLSDDHQRKALYIVAENPVSLITGGPGTGKTYTLARIIASLNKVSNGARIAMAAPTGKAAQRMQEALQKAFSDEALVNAGLVTDELKTLTPVTLHRLLGIGFSGEPEYNQNHQLPYDVIVVDEVSMLDLQLATQLLTAVVDGAKVILLGDSKQLASVDVGGVLADLQAACLLQNAQVKLMKSVRFSDDAPIGRLAKFIQQDFAELHDNELLNQFSNLVDGDAIELQYIGSKGGDSSHLEYLYSEYELYVQTIQRYKNQACELSDLVEAFDRYRILTATRHGNLGLHNVNRYIREKILEYTHQKATAADWYIGRPVMVTENIYKLGLSNGDIGICVKHRTNHGEYEVYFPSSDKWVSTNRLPQSIETAYAMTIHKSQGSEFNTVAVVLDESSKRLLSQELIYTAVTRAKNYVRLIADQESLTTALRVRTRRLSGLNKKFSTL